MRDPLDNKAIVPPRNKGVERFPQRSGNRIVSDRQLTPEEREARRSERAAMAKAREWRRRKKAEARNA